MAHTMLTEPSDIAKAYKTMYGNLEKSVTKKIKATLGHPGGSASYVCKYDRKEDMWWHSSKPKSEDGHYWNPFGIGEPERNKNTNMLLQINYKRKYGRSTSGAFVRDGAGKIYVAHNGLSGGNRKKNPRIEVPKDHRIKLVLADYGRRKSRELFLISDIDSPRLAKNIKEYLGFFTRSKQGINEKDFFKEDETHGDKTPTLEKKITTIRKRNAKAVKELKELYDNRCQISGTKYTFEKKDGEYYSEAHHLVPLGEDGADSVHNMVILSPLFHRMMHYAKVDKFDITNIKNHKLTIKINGKEHKITYNPKHAQIIEKYAL